MRRMILGGAAVLLAAACDVDGPSEPKAAVVISTATFVVAEAGLVSMPTGEEPAAAFATIEPYHGGSAVVAPTIEGGMDPAATGADRGDTLTVTLANEQGTPIAIHNVVVPTRSRPRVVRTLPTRGRRGVPLNSVATVVFSEPIAASSAAGIQIRRNGVAIAGTIETAPDGIRVTLRPAQLLEANTTYELVVPESVTDIDGDPLEQPAAVSFSTGDATAVASIITDATAVVRAPSNGAMRIFTMNAVLRDDGEVEGTFSIVFPSTGGGMTGRVTCFTIVGRDAWVGGVRETSGDNSLIGSEWVWRMSDGGKAERDQLSMATTDEPERRLTAAEFCAATPATDAKRQSITLLEVELGDIAFSGATPPPSAGIVDVRPEMFGDSPDPDGFDVRLGSYVRRVADPARLFIGVPAGRYSPVLESLAPNCIRASTDSVTVEAAKAVVLRLPIHCKSLNNLTRVATRTTGVDLDPDGYLLDPDNAPTHVGVNDTVTFYRTYSTDVKLGDVAANCVVAEPNPQPVSQAKDGVLNFTITCERTTPIVFAARYDTATIDPPGNDLYVMPSSGAVRTRLTSGFDDGDPEWSPDGTRIAFRRGLGAAAEIYVMNADGSGATRLTNNSAADYEPSWSPDGARIAFTSERDGNAEIYVMDANGGNPLRLTNDVARDDQPAWSPATARIAFHSERTGNGDVYAMSADGSAVTRLTADVANEAWPAWSPDGARLVFSRLVPCDRADEGHAWWPCYSPYLMLANGTLVEPLVHEYPPSWAWTNDVAMRSGSWSGDGKKIAFEVVYCLNDLGDCHPIKSIWIVDIAAKRAAAAYDAVYWDSGQRPLPSAPSWSRQP